jgi:endonuclease/exonuclease/phosphatase family metal-dependent hydrolase
MKSLCRGLLVALFVGVGLCVAPVLGAEPVRVRVLTYNIQIGTGMDKKIDLKRTAKVIADLHPDLVALQEVDRLSKRVGGIDEPSELARLTGMHKAFGKALDVPGGEYGELILSRYPLVDVKNHVFKSEEGCESRAAITAKVKLGENGPEILFIGTHLEHANKQVRLRQTERLTQLAEKVTPLSAILAGDFNDTPSSPVLKTILGQWQDGTISSPGPTWPADKPTIKIDYVLYRPADAWRVISCEVVNEPMASDHRPVLVVLEWLGGK